MLTRNKWLLASLIVVMGEIVTISPSNAGYDHSMTSTTHSTVDYSVPASFVDGSFDPETGNFTVEGLGNAITLSPDIIRAIENAAGVSRNNTITRDFDTINPDSSNTITICFSDPCIPSGESTKAISLNELAELIGEDLQNSLDNLIAAESAEQIAKNQPRRFVRRRSDDCVNPAIQAREDYSRRFKASQQFIEQMEQLNPEKNIW